MDNSLQLSTFVYPSIPKVLDPIYSTPFSKKWMDELVIWRDTKAENGELKFYHRAGVEMALVVFTLASVVEAVVRTLFNALFFPVAFFSSSLWERHVALWESVGICFETTAKATIYLGTNLFSKAISGLVAENRDPRQNPTLRKTYISDFFDAMADRFPEHADLIENPLIRLQLELGLSDQIRMFSKGDFSNDKHYQVLGVTKSASHADCRAAYRAAALRSHTDKIREDNDTIRLLNQAKEVLVDDEGSKRPLYDRFGTAGITLLTLLQQIMADPQFAEMAEMMRSGGNPFDSFDF